MLITSAKVKAYKAIKHKDTWYIKHCIIRAFAYKALTFNSTDYSHAGIQSCGARAHRVAFGSGRRVRATHATRLCKGARAEIKDIPLDNLLCKGCTGYDGLYRGYKG